MQKATELGPGLPLQAPSILHFKHRKIASKHTKVSCPSPVELKLHQSYIITSLCSHQLPSAYFSKLVTLQVEECWKLRNLMSISVARGLVNLWRLHIEGCPSMDEVITEEEQAGELLFPRLEELYLFELPKLGQFSLSKHALQFPLLRGVVINECPEMKTFVGDVNTMRDEQQLFNSKVSCPNLEYLELSEADSITALCYPQLPIAYFSKLETLKETKCGKLRNLMSPSVARGFLNLRVLEIWSSPLMEEVITQAGKVTTNESLILLFPRLEELELKRLPKLEHFSLTNHDLEFPFLRRVVIYEFPEMKTFVSPGSVGTPRRTEVTVASWKYAKNAKYIKVEDDLNKTMFNSKKQEPSDSPQR